MVGCVMQLGNKTFVRLKECQRRGPCQIADVYTNYRNIIINENNEINVFDTM